MPQPFKLIQRKYHQVQIGMKSILALLFNLDRQVPPQWHHGLLFRAPSTTSHYLLTTPSHIDLLYPRCPWRQGWHTNTEEDNIRSHWTMDFCKKKITCCFYNTHRSMVSDHLFIGWLSIHSSVLLNVSPVRGKIGFCDGQVAWSHTYFQSH